MKKIISLVLVVIIVLSVCSVSFSDTKPLQKSNISEAILYIVNVQYDSVSKDYLLICQDENGDLWVIELCKSKIYSSKTLKHIKKAFNHEWIIATFNNMNTKDIYDDTILNWYIF